MGFNSLRTTLIWLGWWAVITLSTTATCGGMAHCPTNADEADELMERLDTIMAALTAVTAKVKEQREKPQG